MVTVRFPVVWFTDIPPPAFTVVVVFQRFKPVIAPVIVFKLVVVFQILAVIAPERLFKVVVV